MRTARSDIIAFALLKTSTYNYQRDVPILVRSKHVRLPVACAQSHGAPLVQKTNTRRKRENVRVTRHVRRLHSAGEVVIEILNVGSALNSHGEGTHSLHSERRECR